LIRAFEHGLDPTSSEAGFVLVHIEMVKNSGPLVAGAVACLDACASHLAPSPSSDSLPPRQALNTALSTVLSALQKINATMETMWSRSRPTQYTSFRTFIFGITSRMSAPNLSIPTPFSHLPSSFLVLAPDGTTHRSLTQTHNPISPSPIPATTTLTN
jgi:indoleamine 2,3-dioxygenase